MRELVKELIWKLAWQSTRTTGACCAMLLAAAAGVAADVAIRS